MCAYEDTNHHLWSYLSFMYGARKLCRPCNGGGHHSKNQDYLVSMKGKGKEGIVNCSLILMHVILLSLSVLVLE